MTKSMLIDAAHAEETRVAVVNGNRIEELDFEIASRRQLRGNIYLAKVVRVEPSLQAAFIEYGGNRHGFLAFNEIHPDYYQIPMADREALMRDMVEGNGHDDHTHDDAPHDDSEASEEPGEVSGESNSESGEGDEAAVEAEPARKPRARDEDDAMEQELERRRRRLMRRYKIQEVIRRRQIMLVQVVKEERGNKGAALTTYLSLAGRYSVLMPNTARGGGISRKIDNSSDRKRLKAAVQSLDVPTGMGLIVRTAGAERTKTEIKRDYDYLLRLWESIRDTTMKSVAPAQIYAEEDLVKRAIRDMYDKDVDQILVEGEAGWREARDFMRMIMPSAAKKVVRYDEPTPLFVKHRVEDQLAQIHSPIVPLRSGGYLVINQTEALVAVDVNSGRATRERNIETTAFKTNMEAAEETTRQLRLRDLAGLIVIDFIDMDEGKNNRAVEKKLKDCLAEDRARVQMGKISVFGLMEISRQRRRMGVLEGATNPCPTCHGTGRVRSVESSALSALRALDMEGSRGAGCAILKLPSEVALYVLNSKRGFLSRLEDVHGLEVTIAVDDHLAAGEHAIERTETREGPPRPVPALAPPEPEDDYVEEIEDAEEDEEEDGGPAPRADSARGEGRGEGRGEPRSESDGERSGSRRRRRRRGGRGRDERDGGPERAPREAGDVDAAAPALEGDEATGDEVPRVGESESDRSDGRGRRRRRGRRGGRRTREEGEGGEAYAWTDANGPPREGEASVSDENAYAWSDPGAVKDGGNIERENGEPQGLDPIAAREAEKADTEGKPSRGRNRGRGRRPSDSEIGQTEPLPGPQVAAEAGDKPYGWDTPEALGVEVPVEVEAKPKRARKPSAAALAKTAAAEASAQAVLEAPVAEAPLAETPPAEDAAPAKKPRSRAKKAAPLELESIADAPLVAADLPTPEPEPVPEPVIEAAPEPVAPPAPAQPDPNEITAPPAQPKKGWWRR